MPNAQDEIALFVNAPKTRLQVVDGGPHFLSALHPAPINEAATDFIRRWA